jgi:uncharacterized membrane protein
MGIRNKKIALVVIGIVLTVFATVVRTHDLKRNDPFWVDEFSTARQAKLLNTYGPAIILNMNKPPHYFENRNILTHTLVAVSFKLFGESEWAARLPIAVVGSILPLLVMVCMIPLFGVGVGISSALLIATSYYEIAWSRQARGYMLQQVFVVLGIYLYYKYLITRRKKYAALLALSLILGMLTHPFFYVFILALIIHFAIFDLQKYRHILKSVWLYIFLFICVISAWYIGSFQTIRDSLFKTNNAWFYHAFLWQNYSLFSFLAVMTIPVGFLKKNRWAILLSIYCATHLLIVCLFLGPYTSRYLNAMMPILFILTTYTIYECVRSLLVSNRQRVRLISTVSVVAIALFIVLNKEKFVTRAWPFYSINHDFREVALVDYHQIYGFMKSKGNFTNHSTAIIDTWPDRTHWYMGDSFSDGYLLTWKTHGQTNGIPTGITPYTMSGREKKTLTYPYFGLINELSDLKLAMTKYKHGFIYIDDTSLAPDVLEYVKVHFKKELYVEHYPLDDNPYSIWPATLYSWGYN